MKKTNFWTLKLLSIALLCFRFNAFANIDYEIMGTLRQRSEDLSKWCWVDDKYHKPIGVKLGCVKANGNRLTFHFNRKHDQVLTMIVGADESFAMAGFVFGASAGLDKAVIYGNAYGSVFNFDQKYVDGNIWIYGKMRSED